MHALHEQPVPVGAHNEPDAQDASHEKGGPARMTEEVCEDLGKGRYRVCGQPLEVPLAIADCSVTAQVFTVRAAAVQELLSGVGVSPIALLPGMTAVTLMGVAYRDSPLGRYNEGIISIPVHPPEGDARPVRGALTGMLGASDHFVYAMPVSQAFTCHAGRYLWGYPKFVTPIDVEIEGGRARTRVGDGEGLLFGLDVPVSEHGRLDRAVTNVTVRHATLRRVPSRFTGEGFSLRPGGKQPTIGEHHPLAQALRSLGLPKTPMFSLSLARATATFGVAERL